MAQYTFHEQLLSVMEIVAKAATEEINRRVADSCAVIRVELSRSQKDIDGLKKKCQLMENELRKVRGRGRRKVFLCSTSEKLPFPGSSERNTGGNACRVEQSVPSAQEDPETSTQHIHQTKQIFEDRSAVPTIKEERNENPPWSSGDGAGHFLYESHVAAQETTEEQNRFSEDTASQRTHLAHISSPVTANEIHPNSLRLRVKTEKEEEEEKEVEVILLEGSERRGEDNIQSELAYNSNVSDADTSFTSPERSSGLQSAVFTQHVMESTIEQSGNEAKTIPDDPIEMYSVERFGVHEPQPAWCRDGSHQTDHSSQIQSQRRHGSSTYQHRRALTRPSEDRFRVSTACQPGPDISNQTFLGRGRGGFRRSRAQWVTGADGERRFRCSFCERTFVRFGQLKEHMRSHTGERPYTCNQCGRSFTKQGNLIRHAVVHSGEKPYQCSLCGKRFTQRSSLKSHQKTHTTDRDTVLQGFAVRQLVREQHDSLTLTHTSNFV